MGLYQAATLFSVNPIALVTSTNSIVAGLGDDILDQVKEYC